MIYVVWGLFSDICWVQQVCCTRINLICASTPSIYTNLYFLIMYVRHFFFNRYRVCQIHCMSFIFGFLVIHVHDACYFGRCQPNVETYNSLISAHGRAGQWRWAKNIMEDMLRASVCIYSSLLRYLCVLMWVLSFILFQFVLTFR